VSAIIYRPDIQGLRAIAVLVVIIFHFNPDWLPGGFVGVDIFLVISGFLITSILLNKKDQVNYNFLEALKYFYISRFKRIVPAYFVMLIIVAMLAAVFFLPQDFSIFKKGLEKAAWFNSNSYFSGYGDYFAPANNEQPLLHTWSLAVEIQFYLLAPVLILLLPIKSLKWILSILMVGLTLLAEYRLRAMGIEQATYYSLYARLPEFFAGCLVALCVFNAAPAQSNRPSWLSSVGLVLIILSTIAQPELGAFPGVAALLPVLGCMLLLAKPAEGLVARTLSNKYLVWIGALSYSLYLWHWPVLAVLRYITGAEVLNLGFTVVFVGLTLLLSLVSYYLIEKPFRVKHIQRKQILSWLLLALGIFGVSQSMAKVNTVFTPEQLPIEYRRYADPAIICHGKIVGDCLRGDLSSNREILVLGDSHAAMLNHFFDYLGKQLGFKARIITGSSCVTIPEFDYERIPEWAHERCLQQIKEAGRYIENGKTIFLAGAWNSNLKSKKFINSLDNFLASNQSIYLLSQVPRFLLNVQRVRRFEYLGLSGSVPVDSTYQKANRFLQRRYSNLKNVDFLNFDSLPIFENAPYFEKELMYKDEHHLNEIGSVIYAKSAMSKFSQHIFNSEEK
jgi:peptidoglycan/LPS O-acetylase OafA/YrhL